MLALYTIDAKKIRILIGMKALMRLGAVIGVAGQGMVLSNVTPQVKTSVKMPLRKGRTFVQSWPQPLRGCRPGTSSSDCERAEKQVNKQFHTSRLFVDWGFFWWQEEAERSRP